MHRERHDRPVKNPVCGMAISKQASVTTYEYGGRPVIPVRTAATVIWRPAPSATLAHAAGRGAGQCAKAAHYGTLVVRLTDPVRASGTGPRGWFLGPYWFWPAQAARGGSA